MVPFAQQILAIDRSEKRIKQPSLDDWMHRGMVARCRCQRRRIMDDKMKRFTTVDMEIKIFLISIEWVLKIFLYLI